MCVNKLYIRNNKLDFNPVVDRFYNYVPCGKCEECLRNRSLQYETRSIAEFDYVKSIGGSSFFYTLTYNDLNVPKYSDINVFSKTDVQLYHKRLRKVLNKVSPGIKLTWFLSSEYGHRTLRPHYHVIYYVHSYISPLDFYLAVKSTWRKGFIYPGNNLGLITDHRPFRYVAKYVQKDLYSFDLLDSKGLTRDQLFFYKKNKKSLFKDLDILPFHLQSNNFGVALLNRLSYRNFVEGYFVMTDSLGLSRRVPVPMYLMRKKFYEPYINYNGNVSYMLTNDGIDLTRDRLFASYKSTYDKYFLLSDIVPNYYSKDNDLFSQFNCQSLCKNFFSEFKQHDLVEFVNYKLLYSRSAYCPFTYLNFDSNLDIYINFVKQIHSPNENLSENRYTYYLNKFGFVEKIFDYVERRLKFDKYISNCYKYNARQVLLSFRTGKYKPCIVKSFSQFVNLNTNNLCLTILTSLRDVA